MSTSNIIGGTLTAVGLLIGTPTANVEIDRSTVDPNGVVTAPAGSLVLQTNGSLWINTDSGTTWMANGGAGGMTFANNIVESFGTTSPSRIEQVFVSASNRFDLRGVAVSQATLLNSSAIQITTGENTITGAVAGGASGALYALTGATDTTNAGGTAGNTGAIIVLTGSSTSSVGALSGSTGGVTIQTGDSADFNSGDVIVQTGTAAGTRGSFIIRAATVDCSTQAIQNLVFDNNAAAYSMGSTGALNMLVLDTTNGVERLIVNAVNGLNAVDNVSLNVGTLPANMFSFSYSSGTSTGSLSGAAVTAAGAAAVTRPLTIETGTAVCNSAAAGGASGAMTIRTGNTNITDAGGSAGATGQIQINTGNASSGAGVGSGASGQIQIFTGVSDDAGTGLISLFTGNATSAITSGGLSLATGTVGGAGTTGTIAISTGSADAGGGTSGSITMTIGNAPGGLAGTIQAIGRLTTTDGVVGGTARRVGGLLSSSIVDSTAINQAAAGFSFFDVTSSIPGGTLQSGSILRITAVVRVSVAINGANTATAELRVGGTVVTVSPPSANTPIADERCVLTAVLTARGAPGPAITIAGGGIGTWSDTATSGQAGPRTALTTFNTAGALIVDVGVSTSAAGDTSGRLVLESLVVEVI